MPTLDPGLSLLLRELFGPDATTLRAAHDRADDITVSDAHGHSLIPDHAALDNCGLWRPHPDEPQCRALLIGGSLYDVEDRRDYRTLLLDDASLAHTLIRDLLHTPQYAPLLGGLAMLTGGTYLLTDVPLPVPPDRRALHAITPLLPAGHAPELAQHVLDALLDTLSAADVTALKAARSGR